MSAAFYSSDPQLQRKRAILDAWARCLNARAVEAIAADPDLLDVDSSRRRSDAGAADKAHGAVSGQATAIPR